MVVFDCWSVVIIVFNMCWWFAMVRGGLLWSWWVLIVRGGVIVV
jgi:hypothetical protein